MRPIFGLKKEAAAFCPLTNPLSNAQNRLNQRPCLIMYYPICPRHIVTPFNSRTLFCHSSFHPKYRYISFSSSLLWIVQLGLIFLSRSEKECKCYRFDSHIFSLEYCILYHVLWAYMKCGNLFVIMFKWSFYLCENVFVILYEMWMFFAISFVIWKNEYV